MAYVISWNGCSFSGVEQGISKKKNSIEMMKGTFALFFICFSFFFVWIFCPSSYFVSCKACKPYSVLFIHFVLLDGGDETCRKRDDCSLGDKGFFFVCVAFQHNQQWILANFIFYWTVGFLFSSSIHAIRNFIFITLLIIYGWSVHGYGHAV